MIEVLKCIEFDEKNEQDWTNLFLSLSPSDQHTYRITTAKLIKNVEHDVWRYAHDKWG